MVRGLDNWTYEKRLEELRFFSVENRELGGGGGSWLSLNTNRRINFLLSPQGKYKMQLS